MSALKKVTKKKGNNLKKTQHKLSHMTKIKTHQKKESIQDNLNTKQEETKQKQKIGLKLNWNRAIYINTDIDEKLLKDLTPVILKMKQESSEPITVGIDSPGGNLSIMDSLLGLLKSPDQDGNKTPVYTASTNRAYSAAASFLAFGDYAVAYPHSRILYHDLRYSGIEDLTPTKALQTARELERGNSAFALKVANHIRFRLIWVYLDLRPNFDEMRRRYEKLAKDHDEAFAELLPSNNNRIVDVVAFALTLYQKLSTPVDRQVALKALGLLKYWMEIEKIEKRISSETSKGKKSVDIVQGICDLVSEIRAMSSESKTLLKKSKSDAKEVLDNQARKDIKILVEVLARRFATDDELNIGEDGLDLIIEDFAFIKDINSKQHVHDITRMILDNDIIFFGRSIADEIKNAKDNDERKKILEPVYPQARILWHYIVLLCRCLCRGDHFLRPSDAQLLGLVDEVLGGGPVESRREWRKKSPDFKNVVSQ